jgi:hypothetical protein
MHMFYWVRPATPHFEGFNEQKYKTKDYKYLYIHLG